MKNLMFIMISLLAYTSNAQVVDDYVVMNEDESDVINVINNDVIIAPQYDLYISTSPSNGTVTLGPGIDEITYTPNPNFNGIDVFDYLVTNTAYGGTWFGLGQVSITINPVNDAPTISLSSQVTPQNTALNICPTIADVDDPLTNLYIGGSTLTINPNSSITGPDMFNCFVYTPNLNYNGVDNVFFVVCDQYLCDTVFVPITVTPLNTSPLAVDDNINTLINTSVIIDVLANDTDDSNIDPTSVTIINDPVNGNTTIDPTTGQITYIPNPNFIGTETITYTVCDDGAPTSTVLCSNIATVVITVLPLNVEGTIMSSSSAPLQNSVVYLIEQNGNLLFIDQTTTTDANGFYQFYNVPQTFYIKAIPNQTLYPADVPTYYLNSGVFQYATAITPTVSPFIANFNTAAGLNPGGAGFIAGFVGQGAGKNSAEGDPIVDLDIVLMDTNSSIVAHTKTDAQGMFEFNNLEIADYFVWVDNGSVDNTNASIISLGTENDQTDLKFVLEEDALILKTVSSINDLKEGGFKLYPNPSKGIINISSNEVNSTYEVEIVNILGESVYSRFFETNNVKINLLEKGFNRGTYFLKLTSKDSSYFSKIVIKK